MTAQWVFIAALHNLPVVEAVGNELFAVVPIDDQRVEGSRNQPAFKQLTAGFTDQFGRPRTPSLLIAHPCAPMTTDAVVDFRNALAISSITAEWARQLCYPNQRWFIKYSEYFLLYPYQPTKKGDALVVHSPSLLSLDDENFRGQTSPEIATIEPRSAFYDRGLLTALLSCWEQQHLGRRKRTRNQALFRSLQMAFRAGMLPFGNNASLTDFGAQLALWVSAHEILVWPRHNHASLRSVLDLLAGAQFESKELGRRRYRGAGKGQRVRLLDKLYVETYNARSDFIHGNPISTSSLFPSMKRERSGANLLSFAPLIYRAALYSALGLWRSQGAQQPYDEFLTWWEFEEALLGALKR